ncbi:zinc-finger domain-containing protein [Cyclospora cayetanensis]|uniref:Zinc-finger domain-containing protein n=1 Tax=Cyclospora cayetanensis TaxID=88456 RepID=A0A1D3D0C3_9EIME|nr:zinc-finger domain-containing protein [Cyclospora cayetanensis]
MQDCPAAIFGREPRGVGAAGGKQGGGVYAKHPEAFSPFWGTGGGPPAYRRIRRGIVQTAAFNADLNPLSPSLLSVCVERGGRSVEQRSAQEAERGVDTLAKRLPDLLVTICRKATAIASNSGLREVPCGERCSAETAAEEDEAAVEAAAQHAGELAVKAARLIQEALGEATPAEGGIKELTERVLFLGGSHASSAGPRDEADDVSVEPQQRGPAATGGRSLGAPDIVFFKCPLTQEQFRLPVSQRYEAGRAVLWHLDDASGVCPHVFEEEAILHVMKGQSIACPFAGCRATVHRGALRRDVETEEHFRELFFALKLSIPSVAASLKRWRGGELTDAYRSLARELTSATITPSVPPFSILIYPPY